MLSNIEGERLDEHARRIAAFFLESAEASGGPPDLIRAYGPARNPAALRGPRAPGALTVPVRPARESAAYHAGQCLRRFSSGHAIDTRVPAGRNRSSSSRLRRRSSVASLVSGVAGDRGRPARGLPRRRPERLHAAVDRRQMATVRAALPPGASLLLVATADERLARPTLAAGALSEHTVIVRYRPCIADELNRFRGQYADSTRGLAGMASARSRVRSHEDLGTLPGLPGRVWFGELAP